MDLHAAFESTLTQHASAGGPAGPVAAVGGDGSDDLYASIMSKEDNVLELIRRMDETRRSEALNRAENLVPLFHAFVSGMSTFTARLVHYSSKQAFSEVVGLITSPEGMVYTGTALVVLAILLMVI